MTTPPSSYHQNADVFFATLESNKVQEDLLKRTMNTSSFQSTFTDQLRRVYDFCEAQQQGLESQAKTLFLRAHALLTETTSSSSSIQSFATVHDLKRSTQKTVEDVIALQEFYTNSRNTLLDIASSAQDNENSYSTMIYNTMPKAHIHSSLVCVISDLYHALREAEHNIQNQSNANLQNTLWQAPSSFQRVTTKYWVKHENLTKLMLICAAQAPLLVYGKQGPLTSTDPSHVSISEGDKLWDTLATQITSIYFDSSNMSLYKERIARAEGAQLLRVRWYGPTMPLGDSSIFVELKTHHEKWVGNKSVKERATIQEGDMLRFLEPVPWHNNETAEQMVLRGKPNLKGEELQKATALLLRMHNLVVKHKLTACVRTRYDRAAFQSSKSNDLRLTLDRNVTVVNERMKQQPTSGHWCLTDSEAQTARASVVPFNVFEVKLAGNDPMPAGLAAAMSDSTIELAPKYSKFLTGAAAFNSVPTLPYWAAHSAFYSFFELDKRWASNNNNTSADEYYHLMDNNNDDTILSILPKGVVIAPKYPARVEPKTFFANERTFIQWVSASILLLSVSSFMLTSGGNHFSTTAAVISFAAFCLVVYSTVLYFRRLILLKERRAYGYFNKANPIFLTTVVGIAVFLVWADSIKGSDFLTLTSMFTWSGGRRALLAARPGRVLHQEYYYKTCPREIVGTSLLMMKENPSSLVVDVKRRAFLISSGESVYIQPMANDDGSVHSKKNRLIKVNQSHLQGLAIVGDDQLFAISDGPERTELIEMAWWGTRSGENERLLVVGRWTLEKNKSHVDGFSFVPSADTRPMGRFYINMNSSISSYSVPARSESPESDQYSYPTRMKSLNMKVLTQGMVGDIGSNDRLSTMVTFEGITFILRSKQNVLEAWNLTDGKHVSEIALPATDEDNTMMKWTGFALERRISAITTETPNVRGGEMLEIVSSDALFLHLMTDAGTVGGQIWSFPVLEDIQTPGGLFSVPECQLATSSMN